MERVQRVQRANLHFLHVRSQNPAALALLLLHDWPCSSNRAAHRGPRLVRHGQWRRHRFALTVVAGAAAGRALAGPQLTGPRAARP
ncbi:epoxide hydrolase N-terminal domain-containing protein [Streptomyces sp. NPDC058662]|uniref:epoxide hydrolase N-terminal domain-containing protein n=1 Tax=Streptomyces sp. NPDC058662 TaxID=3346583 RepID=UPI00365E02E6